MAEARARADGPTLWQRIRLSVSPTEMIAIGVFVAIFLAASASAEIFSRELEEFLGSQSSALWLYVPVVVVGELLLPGATLPLIPIYAHMLGNVVTALATAAAWLVSAEIAFGLARRFGSRFVRKLLSQSALDKAGLAIERRHLFRTVVLFRLVFPVNVTSFAAALFTRMPWREHLLASMLGLIPYAFLLVHISVLPLEYRLAFDVVGLTLTAIAYFWIRGRVVQRLREGEEPRALA